MNKATEVSLDSAITLSALRLTELNNKMQAVNEGGVRLLSREIQRYVARTMVKRDTAETIHRALRLAHAAVQHLESENRRLLQLLTDIKDNAEIAAASFSERLP